MGVLLCAPGPAARAPRHFRWTRGDGDDDDDDCSGDSFGPALRTAWRTAERAGAWRKGVFGEGLNVAEGGGGAVSDSRPFELSNFSRPVGCAMQKGGRGTHGGPIRENGDVARCSQSGADVVGPVNVTSHACSVRRTAHYTRTHPRPADTGPEPNRLKLANCARILSWRVTRPAPGWPPGRCGRGQHGIPRGTVAVRIDSTR